MEKTCISASRWRLRVLLSLLLVLGGGCDRLDLVRVVCKADAGSGIAASISEKFFDIMTARMAECHPIEAETGSAHWQSRTRPKAYCSGNFGLAELNERKILIYIDFANRGSSFDSAPREYLEAITETTEACRKIVGIENVRVRTLTSTLDDREEEWE